MAEVVKYNASEKSSGKKTENNIMEDIYLMYRKCKAAITSSVFFLYGMLPVQKNKIVFCSIEGQSGYSCNPRYVAEELLGRKGHYQLIWLVNDKNRMFPSGIKKVKNSFWNRAYHLSTAGVWVDNSRKPLGTRKRKKQLYIQTWHATLAFKPAGRMRASFPPIAYMISKNDSEMADYILTDSEWCDRLYPELLLSCGNTLRTGSPRCDILCSSREQKKKELRKKHNLPVNTRIVLYAPTFRGGGQNRKRKVFAEDILIDMKRLRESLSQRWAGDWYIFIRLHPQLSAGSASIGKADNERIYDVSREDDMNEIIAGVDAFITDYSSAAFDAGMTGMPVLIYADDMEEFSKDRGNLLWDLEELPFPMASNNDELESNIKSFDEEKYSAGLKKLFAEAELLQDGHASERVADIIEQFIIS